MISRIETQLRDKDIGLELTQNAKKFLADNGFDPMFGARPLRRTIQREIEDPLSERVLFNELKPGQIVVVDREGDPRGSGMSKLVFRILPRGAAPGSRVWPNGVMDDERWAEVDGHDA